MRILVTFSVAALALLATACATMGKSSASDDTYAVVVTKDTQSKPDWAAVVETLQKKHQAEVVVVPEKLEECAARLKELQPRYVCFVARPEEVSTDTVRALNKLSRAMDDDPFVDYLWGIITGYTAEDA